MVSGEIKKMVCKKFPGILAAPLLACAPPHTAEASSRAEAPTVEQQAVAGVEEALPDLPFSRGHSFANLEAYLAYLERTNGPIDLPWWREIRPGVFQQVIRMTDARPETATRDELNRRFGFES